MLIYDGKTFVPMRAAMRFMSSEKEDYGYKWRVRVVEFGTDKNGTHWTKEPLTAALAKFEGAKVFMLSEAQHSKGEHPYGKPTTEIVGWLSNVSADDTGIVADLNILKTASHLRDALVDSFERGNKDLFALSLDLTGQATKKKVDGSDVVWLESVSSVTVDIVYDPAAGGQFLRMAAAAMQAGQKKEDNMFKRLLAALKGLRPDLKGQIEALECKDDVSDEEMGKLLAAATSGAGDAEKILAALKTDGSAVAEAKEILHEARLVTCAAKLDAAMNGSGLPKEAQEKLRAAFAGKIFADADLDAAIKTEKDYLDKLTGGGMVTDSGDVRVIAGHIENSSQMLDDFFAGKVHSFKACYAHITGDGNVTGHLRAATRLRASIDTTSFAEIFGDSVARKIVKDYRAAGMDEWRKICNIVPLADFRTNRRVRIGGYGDLPAVAQGGAYNALTSPGDEESTYAPTKRGGTEDLTLEAIKNDDVGAIRMIPVKMARAAKRTLYKFVFDFLRTNPTIYDAKALFHVDHGNLGSAALDATSLRARRQAMLKQVEAGSSEVLGIPPKYLIVPVDLDKTAYDLIAAPRNSDFDPTSADYTRTLQMEMIVVPYWTDANDWCLMADPNDIEVIEIGFLDGNEEPEIFVQDMPTVGSMFSNDKLTYKIRHIYGGTVKDYRGADKSVVL